MTEKNAYRGAALCVLFLSVTLRIACAGSVDILQARQAAQGWLRLHPQPLATAVSADIKNINAALLEGKALFYAVDLEPSGFMILSADDRLEPVIAFSDTGTFSADPESPLYDLALRDLSNRLARLEEDHKRFTANRLRWNNYVGADQDLIRSLAPPVSVSDLRVDPLVESLWGQENAAGLPCYDYYVPPPGEPDSDPNNNIRCGCVATAMAQVMRYHRHPQEAVGVSAYTVTVSGTSRTAYTRGGDGLGGPYHWCQMPLAPDALITESQRQAIGALCHDAGLTVNMSYSHSGSGAAMRKIHQAFKTFFDYSCAYYGIGSYDAAAFGEAPVATLSMPTADLNQMINPGLDAGYPSILGLDGPYAGHAVVVDGYGYHDQTLYHHLNMGWYGRDNAWYALPDVNSMPPFSVIDACIYNIFPSDSGEIVSGRVLDGAGLPIGQAVVTASQNGALCAQDVTNERGIYALVNLPSQSTYIIHAHKQGFTFAPQPVYVAISTSQGEPGMTGITGNVWGVDFYPGAPEPPVAIEPQEPYIVDANSLTIILAAVDDGEPNDPGRLTFIVESLPEHGFLYDPNFGHIVDYPHALRNDANTVIYEPCGYYRGNDTFTFKANDGGTPPTGGDSNLAAIPLEVTDRQIGQADQPCAYPFHTSCHDCRMQLIYTAAEVAGPALFSGLWLNVIDLPCRQLNNFTIRLQMTPMTEYPAESDFVNTEWTTVYRNDDIVTATGWYRFDFEAPFDCNEPNNVLLDISFDNATAGACDGTVYGCFDPNRVIAQVSDSLHGDPLQWTAAMFGGVLSEGFRPAIRLIRFNPEAWAGDLDANCRVDLQDLLMFAERWLAEYPDSLYNRAYDIGPPANARIGLEDFATLASQWLLQKE